MSLPPLLQIPMRHSIAPAPMIPMICVSAAEDMLNVWIPAIRASIIAIRFNN